MVGICIVLILCTVKDFLSTRSLHVFVWNYIVVLDIPTQVRRGCPFDVSRGLLAILPGYHGVSTCPFDDVPNCLP
jgi:hypothetical protein